MPILPGRVFDNLLSDLKTLFSNTIKFHQDKINEDPSLFTDKDMTILKNLKKNKSIIISKPDKGRGVVIMNKNDCYKNEPNS